MALSAMPHPTGHERQDIFMGGSVMLNERSDESTTDQDSTLASSQMETSSTSDQQQIHVKGVAVDATIRNGNTSDDERGRDVRELARQYTKQSTYSTIDRNPFDYEPGSILDPDSENFKPKAWAKALLRFQDEGGNFKGRCAGLIFRNLSVYGHGSGTNYQKSVGNIGLQALGMATSLMGTGPKRIDILRGFNGLVRAGEMLIVLGPPGSGCSTFLKTIAGDTHGFKIEKDSYINYQGISSDQMRAHFRGEAVYTAEQDVHFPIMTVGDTLYFAARARAPRIIPGGLTKRQYAEHSMYIPRGRFLIEQLPTLRSFSARCYHGHIWY
jgi:ATP-binding cassette, subfamily G (WHITE), member 2, PDR